MSLLGTMLVFLWDQENGGANSSSGCSEREVLGSKDECGEGVDAQWSVRGGEDA